MMKKTIRRIALITALASLLTVVGYLVVFQMANIRMEADEYWFTVKSPNDPEALIKESGLVIEHPGLWKIACMAKRLKTIKPGRYRLTSGMTNSDIIREFRSGGKPTLTLRIDDTETLEELAAKLGEHLLNDSSYFMAAFETDSLLKQVGIRKEELAAFIRPNTYEFYWNMSAEDFLKKMSTETDKIWTSERVERSSSIGLTRFETTVLASIVKAETGSIEEAPMIAGLYLNRLRIGMPLQSDPTALFGRKKSAQRVYTSDIRADSPYNTYLFSGLPPGPINFPETSYIDAVLNAKEHNYIYMCAEAGGSGKHRFAISYGEHEKNRRDYIQWLEKKGIR